jgi:hypothetical protein
VLVAREADDREREESVVREKRRVAIAPFLLKL